MQLRATTGRHARGQSTAGGIFLRVLVGVAAGAIGWLWWQGARPATKGTARIAPQGTLIKSNGTWIIPVADRDGKVREPMVLVPVNRAETPAAATAPAPPKPAPAATATNQISAAPLPAPTNAPRSLAMISPNPTSIAPVRPLNGTNTTDRSKSPFDERLLTAQVALARMGISSGSLDGVPGPQTRAAIRAFQQRERMSASGTLDAATLEKLALDEPLYTNYVVSTDDFTGLQPIGTTWLAKSQQSSLAHETLLERIAERTHTNPKLVRWLNPAVNWDRVEAGTDLKVIHMPDTQSPTKAAFVRIFLADRKLQAYDAETNLIAHFPCSIAARVDKRPLGEELHISVVAPHPNYTFDPAVFPESAEARELGRKLILQPGPNNPVGTAWLGLDKPGYGIHGTPKPEDVGRTESHGCFRLANWNAEHLLKLVTVGTPVFVEP